jgi:hypothetical protein
VEVTGAPGENHRFAASHWQTLSYKVVWIVLYFIQQIHVIWILHQYLKIESNNVDEKENPLQFWL